jgi:LuxR family maltose regulon positive regulatory protein
VGTLGTLVADLGRGVARAGGRVRTQGDVVLTEAELRVLRLLPTHLSLAEIAEELDVSRNTVKSQVAAAYRKLRAETRAEAVDRARELGLVAS